MGMTYEKLDTLREAYLRWLRQFEGTNVKEERQESPLKLKPVNRRVVQTPVY